MSTGETVVAREQERGGQWRVWLHLVLLVLGWVGCLVWCWMAVRGYSPSEFDVAVESIRILLAFYLGALSV